jgi:hypothetical protein
MTDEDDLTPTWGKARKAAFAETMEKFNGERVVPLTATLAFTELDEWGLPETGTPGPESRPSGRATWRVR